MQLVREIEVGMDVDGDGARDLDPARISYFGQSFGGIYGVKFLAVEPNVRLGVPNVAGGAIIEIARLSPSFRGLVTLSLLTRTPPLINLPGFAFNENMPLRNLPPLDRHRARRQRDPTADRVVGMGAAVGQSGGLRRPSARGHWPACRRSG